MVRLACVFVAAALSFCMAGASFAADAEPAAPSKAGPTRQGAASHQLFLRELAAMASRETRADVRLSDEQLNTLRAIQAEYRAAISNVPSGVNKAREKVADAQKEVDAARDAKTKMVEEMRSKIESMQAQLEKLRSERDALKGPDRAAKKQQIDTLKAELDALKNKFQAARDEANTDIEQAQENKGAAADQRKESIDSLRRATDEGAYRARMIEALTPAQRAALEKRLADAEEAIKLIDAAYSGKND